MTQENLDKIYNELIDNNYFTEKELLLVIKGWGDNIETYDTVCQVRYGMDAEQLLGETEE